ncbi:hypothetical protein SBRCBS47491_003398 [Sporothrix bragantina]|uniref:FAD-binding FR-type domain-containing protein n=1 Tax=Sporothrix bragantina TaxID=671064 RepID=A0ABP0BF32_9PEZI
MPDGMPSPSSAPRLLTHRTSRRVTASISFHSFCTSPDPDHPSSSPESAPLSQRWLRPTQNVTLQFSEDLDPAKGKHGMSVADRRCTFTPCCQDRDTLEILTRNGRVTGLLGLPRPYQTLTAEVVEVGGGFSPEVLADASVCIAGGTGIAPFLTMRGSSHSRSKKLCWSLRSDDFGAVEFALKEGLLQAEDWVEVAIFVTSGEDGAGVVVEKPASWWETTFATLRQANPSGRLSFAKRRMAAEDIFVEGGEEPGQKQTILFCGSKSLEWQIRIWAMMFAGGPNIHCTEVV